MGAGRTQSGPQRPWSVLLLPPFFDLGPTCLSPLLDGFLVSLGGSMYRLLAAPTTGLQNAADMGRMVRDPETVSDQGCHSGLGPHLPLEAESFRSLGK
jgi:hypothetical protein